MLTPKTIHDDLHEHHTQVVQLFSKHPWLIPATTLLHIIPVVVGINGFWKSRALSKQLKIEREKRSNLPYNRSIKFSQQLLVITVSTQVYANFSSKFAVIINTNVVRIGSFNRCQLEPRFNQSPDIFTNYD
ncbi:hypothetical protein ACE5SX_03995 [Lactiplantibacillus plantarum]|uniref:hypothetical protein n=2 Tax=Lactiplantibacillus plantarum TaxID=1590 RepID=UPI003C23BA11